MSDRMIVKTIGMVCLLMLFTHSLVYAADKASVEWAPFIKKSTTSDEQLIAAANTVQTEFLGNQKGFVKRELIKKNDVEYADIVHWETKTDAESAAANVNTCDVCIAYFSLMDMEQSESAGAGFSHYQTLYTWDQE